ncbi:hypothetical protein GCM10027512_06050 [Chromohalobacter beijerinckii]
MTWSVSLAWQIELTDDRLNTSVLEGINNRIKIIKRMAYGYRDTAYFFLKSVPRIPAKCDEPQKGQPLAIT